MSLPRERVPSNERRGSLLVTRRKLSGLNGRQSLVFEAKDHSIAEIMDSAFLDALNAMDYADIEECINLDASSLRSRLDSNVTQTDSANHRIEFINYILELSKEELLETIGQQESGSGDKLNAGSNAPELIPKETSKQHQKLNDVIKKSKEKLKRIESLRGEITQWLADANDSKPVGISNGGIIPPILSFQGQNNERLALNNLMAVSTSKIEETQDKNDPFKNLLQRMPKFNFPRTDTGFKNKILFGNKGSRVLQFGKDKLLEVETREDALVNQLKNLVTKEIEKLSPEEQKRIDLRNAPLNFIRNPRFDQNIPEGELSSCGLIAEPSAITFTDYIPYKTYTKKMVIRNTSKLSHRFRVQYASGDTLSEFFRFQISESPTKDYGLVASGLCSTYLISFTPNSFGMFEETLMVLSEEGSFFSVSILASNKAPILTLPDEIDCGECRPGFETSRYFPFTNNGGYARFIVMTQTETRTPFQLFDEIGAGNHGDIKPVTIGKFTISPAYFEIRQYQTVNLLITYAPTDKDIAGATRDSGTMTLACDNCFKMNYSLSGYSQSPKMLVSEGFFPKGNRIITHDPELCLWPFDMNLDFLIGNPLALDICYVSIKNSTGLTLPFRWAQCDYIVGAVYEESRHENAFSFTPLSGTFEPWSEIKFQVIFCPQEEKSYDVLAEMLLVGPTKGDDNSVRRLSKLRGEKNECLSSIRLSGKSVAYDAILSKQLIPLPLNFKTGGSFETSIQLFNNNSSPMDYLWTIEGIDENFLNIDIYQSSGTLSSRTSVLVNFKFTAYLPIQVTGNLICKTVNGRGPTLCVRILGEVQLSPRSLVFNSDFIDFGLFALGEQRQINVPLVNSTNLTMNWQVSSLAAKNDDYFIQIKPTVGTLLANEKCTISLNYFPTWYQKLHDSLRVHLISLKNSGGEETVLNIPLLMSSIDVIGIVQTPCIKLVNSVNRFSCFLNVPFRWKLDLKNTRQLSTYFRWPDIENKTFRASFYPSSGQLKGGETQQLEIEICFLKPGSNIGLEILGDVMDMVEDNGKMVLMLDANVVQYEFSFRVLENEIAWKKREIIKSAHLQQPTSANLRLDFGLLCPISDVRTRTIKIRNHSAIESQFNIKFLTYTPTLDESSDIVIIESDDAAGEIQVTPPQRTPALLKPSLKAKIGFSSKSGQQYIQSMTKFRGIVNQMKRILSEGRGAAFHAVPSQGVIKPWAEVEIKISSYNNLVGIYQDEMVCQVEDITQTFPVRLGVIGTPVKVSGAQLISRIKEVQRGGIDVEKVNFGARVINLTAKPTSTGSKSKVTSYLSKRKLSLVPSGFPAISKVIQVDNNSPRDVVLDWRVYVNHTPLIHVSTISPQQVAIITENMTPGKEEENSNNISIALKDLTDIITTDMIVRPENFVNRAGHGIFEVSPSFMTIPAYKSAPLKCSFRNMTLGSFEALVMADVAYLEKDGSHKYAPKASKLPGKWPAEEKIDEKMLQSGNVQLKDLESVALFGIKGKCIEPKLSLDGADFIRVKVPMKQEVGQKTVVIAFIDNHSDAVCEFALHASPSDMFKVKGSQKNIKVDLKIKKIVRKPVEAEQVIYELKQTQQIMITLEYTHVNPKLQVGASGAPGKKQVKPWLPRRRSFTVAVMPSRLAPDASLLPHSSSRSNFISFSNAGIVSERQIPQLPPNLTSHDSLNIGSGIIHSQFVHPAHTRHNSLPFNEVHHLEKIMSVDSVNSGETGKMNGRSSLVSSKGSKDGILKKRVSLVEGSAKNSRSNSASLEKVSISHRSSVVDSQMSIASIDEEFSSRAVSAPLFLLERPLSFNARDAYPGGMSEENLLTMPKRVAQGEVIINFTNGMTQQLPIVVEFDS